MKNHPKNTILKGFPFQTRVKFIAFFTLTFLSVKSRKIPINNNYSCFVFAQDYLKLIEVIYLYLMRLDVFSFRFFFFVFSCTREPSNCVN
jgi:hypothetical protein